MTPYFGEGILSDKPTILIIDDDRRILIFLEKVLKRTGYNVLKSAGGEEGVNTARQEFPDLIICDYMMPKFSGEDVVRELKSEALTAIIPIIILTATTDKEIDFLQAGAADYLVKPVKTAELIARVDRTLADIDAVQLRLLKEFTGALAHELNNPLTVIKGRLQMLQISVKGTPNLENHVDEALAALAKLLTTVDKFHELRNYQTRKYVRATNILDIHRTDNS
ncbi:response regulator [Planctomycetota bacterium]